MRTKQGLSDSKSEKDRYRKEGRWKRVSEQWGGKVMLGEESHAALERIVSFTDAKHPWLCNTSGNGWNKKDRERECKAEMDLASGKSQMAFLPLVTAHLVLVYGGPNKHSRDAQPQLLIFPPPAKTLISNLCVWFSLCAFPCRGETRGSEINVRLLKWNIAL